MIKCFCAILLLIVAISAEPLCDCNEHAVVCDPVSGACINCTDNTAGFNCDSCIAGYYANSSLLPNNTNYCTACACNEPGSVNGSCDSSGVCYCKANVDPSLSSKCSVCADGYWNLSLSNDDGCEACTGCGKGVVQANSLSLCNKTTGQCICQNSRVKGVTCSYCEDGYYNVSSGCSMECQCNERGSIGQSCTDSGQCYCKDNITGRACDGTANGYYFRSLDHIRMEGEEGVGPGIFPYFPIGDMTGFTGRGYAIIPASGSNITFIQQVDVTSQYQVIIRYTTTGSIFPVFVQIDSLSNVTRTVSCSVVASNSIPTTYTSNQLTLNSQSKHGVLGSLCFQEGIEYRITLHYTPTQGAGIEWLLDSLVLMPDIPVVSNYYNSLSLVDQINAHSCLPFSLDFVYCFQKTFEFSVEFYGQVFACGTPNTAGTVNSTCNPFGGDYSCHVSYIGSLCDECSNGYYSNLTTNSCQACPSSCNETGAINVACNASTGLCQCKSGVTGDSCNICQLNYHSFSSAGCSPCNCSPIATCNEIGQCICPINHYLNSSNDCTQCACNPRGSYSQSCNETTGQCYCRENVTGLKCDDCSDGYYSTQGNEQSFCVSCFCFNHSMDCVSDNTGYVLGTVESNFATLCSTQPTDCDEGWVLLENDTVVQNAFLLNNNDGIGYSLTNGINPQLVAPSKYHGDFHLAYGQRIDIVIKSFLFSQTPTRNVSIWIYGSGLAEPLVALFPAPNITAPGVWQFTFPLTEGYWRVGNGSISTSHQLLSVLVNITDIRFGADFTQDIYELNHVESFKLYMLQEAGLAAAPAASFTVENCTCPIGHTGQFCDQCSVGYYCPSGNPLDACLPCQCDGLTTLCHPVTGICYNCSNNTRGEYCDECVPGFYDNDPTSALECLPCFCPSHSPNSSCTLASCNGTVVCERCDIGYIGDTCQFCDNGFYRNITTGSCVPCDCNGNIDPLLGLSCNSTTGECLLCQNNTTGFNCEQCLPGYYGSISNGIACQECSCHLNGTESGVCDPITGACLCLPLTNGSDCSQCRSGFWGLSSGLGCIACNCCSNGSLFTDCDQDTGRCNCLDNGRGSMDDKCCQCSFGYYNFSNTGCTACNCGELSLSAQCDTVTGQCPCMSGGIGKRCDGCPVGFSGIAPNCTQCHDCFSEWFDTLSSLQDNITLLMNRTRDVLGFYDGYTSASITSIIANIQTTLNTTETRLLSITPDFELISNISSILAEVNETYTDLILQVSNLQQSLTSAQYLLDAAGDYVTSVNTNGFNGNPVSNIYQILSALNETFKSLESEANQNYATLQAYQTEVEYLLQSNLSSLLANAGISESHIVASYNTSVMAYSLANVTSSFGHNITAIMSALSMIGTNIVTLENRTLEVNGSVDDLTRDFGSLDYQLTNLTDQLNDLSGLAKILLSSAESIKTQSQFNLQSVQALMASTNQAVADAQSLLALIGLAEEVTFNASMTLSGADIKASNITAIPVPMITRATQLAHNINSTIVSNEDIVDLVSDANSSAVTAMETLESVQNTSSAVQSLHSLVDTIISDYNETQMDLRGAEESLLSAGGRAKSISGTLNKVNATLNALPGTSEANSAINNKVNELNEGERMLQSLLLNSTSASNVSQQIQSTVANENKVLQSAVMNASEVQQSTGLKSNASSVARTQVSQLQNKAQQLNDTANAVALQRLQDLLTSYKSKLSEVTNIRQNIARVKNELTAMTATLQNSTEKYRNCYKTP